MPISTGPIQLTGTILNPDGTPANGFFTIVLNTYASVLPVAGGYKAILPNRPIFAFVENGQVQSPSPGIYGNDVLQGASWYIVTYYDNNNPEPLFQINTYIIGNSPFDMGSMQAIQIDYPTILTLAQYVASLSSSVALGESTLQGTLDGVNTTLTGPTSFSLVFRNGLFQTPGVDYTAANGTYTFTLPCGPSDVFWAVSFDTDTSAVVNSIQLRDTVTGEIVTVSIADGALTYGT